MAFTVNIDDHFQDPGARELVVRCTITDGSKQKINPEYRVTTELDLKQRINADISTLSSVSVNFPKIVNGPYDPTIVPPALTPAEQAKILYQSDLTTLQQMVRAIGLGIKTSSDQDYLNLRDSLKTRFSTEYLSLF